MVGPNDPARIRIEPVAVKEKYMVITRHATGRMLERMNTRKDKLIKIAWKAWRSEEALSHLSKVDKNSYRHGQDRVGRAFSGLIFVFKERHNSIILITVIHPGQDDRPPLECRRGKLQPCKCEYCRF
jgi:hypothetical protein